MCPFERDRRRNGRWQPMGRPKAHLTPRPGPERVVLRGSACSNLMYCRASVTDREVNPRWRLRLITGPTPAVCALPPGCRSRLLPAKDDRRSSKKAKPLACQAGRAFLEAIGTALGCRLPGTAQAARIPSPLDSRSGPRALCPHQRTGDPARAAERPAGRRPAAPAKSWRNLFDGTGPPAWRLRSNPSRRACCARVLTWNPTAVWLDPGFLPPLGPPSLQTTAGG